MAITWPGKVSSHPPSSKLITVLSLERRQNKSEGSSLASRIPQPLLHEYWPFCGDVSCKRVFPIFSWWPVALWLCYGSCCYWYFLCKYVCLLVQWSVFLLHPGSEFYLGNASLDPCYSHCWFHPSTHLAFICSSSHYGYLVSPSCLYRNLCYSYYSSTWEERKKRVSLRSSWAKEWDSATKIRKKRGSGEGRETAQQIKALGRQT